MTATIQDVINAENDLTFARNTRTEAVESFANGVARLWRDMGVLLDRQGIHIDKAQPKKLFQAETASPFTRRSCAGAAGAFQTNEALPSVNNHCIYSCHLRYRVFLLMPSLRAAAEKFPPHSSTALRIASISR